MNEIIEKINNSRPLEKDDILKIVSLYIQYYDLDLYVKDVWFNPKYFYPACYHKKMNVLIFNDEKVINNAYHLYDVLYNMYGIDENYFNHIINFHYLYLIYHELDHANQKKIYEENDDNELFSYLYDIRKRLQLNKGFYDTHHDLFPMEKAAINNGSLKAYNLISLTNLPERERDILHLLYLIRRIYDYRVSKKTIISPISRLFELSQEDRRFFDEIIAKTNLSMEERLNFGLDLSYDEYAKLTKEKSRVFKKVNNNF